MEHSRVVLDQQETNARKQGFWAELRAAMKGEERDYTAGSMGRAISLLAIPMVLEMVMESVLTVVDVYFVGRLGSEAIAAVGLSEAAFTLIHAIAIGLSMAATAMVARRIGEKDKEGARRAAVQAIVLSLIISVPIGILGAVNARDILMMMGADEGVLAVGVGNVAVLLGFNATLVLLTVINGIFRGAGDPTMAVRSLWLANIINIALDPCLIFGLGPFPELGVAGAAVASSIGRGTAVLYQLYVLTRVNDRISIRKFKIYWSIVARLMKLSWGGILQWIIATSSWIAVVRIVATFGSDAVAGYTIGVRIIIFALLPAVGMCNAAATLVGQNLGARQPKRAEDSVWMSVRYNMIFLGMVGLFLIICAPEIIGIFNDNPLVVQNGVHCLRMFCYGFPMIAIGMVLVHSFNGAGDTFTPTVINFFCYWIFQIPAAWTFAVAMEMGPMGAYLGCLLTEIALAIVASVVFRRGKWKLKEV